MVKSKKRPAKEKTIIKLLETAQDLVDTAKKSSGAKEIFSNKEIKPIGNSSHIVLPKKYGDGKHRGLVFIKEFKQEEGEKK